MRITIIADASFCPTTNQAGYAFWISSERGKRGGDGVFKGSVVNNIASEMMALLNGLFVGCTRNIIQNGDTVLLQTDCQAAIDAFTLHRKNITEQEKDLVRWLRRIQEEFNLTINLRHVKGHTNGRKARYVVNGICDQKAKVNMRKARTSYLLQEISNIQY